MNTFRFIGDVHGHFDRYIDIIKDASGRPTIQVGDFGIGFQNSIEHILQEDFPAGEHYFIRGNHDDPDRCLNQYSHFNPDNKGPVFIQDGHPFHLNGTVFFPLGGALSIDKQWRTPGVTWWEGEELTVSRLDECIQVAEKLDRCDVVVTHDCPDFLVPYLKNNGQEKDRWPSRTRQALDSVFEFIGKKPKVWVFGHWHKSLDITINDTRFICLNELEYIDLSFEVKE